MYKRCLINKITNKKNFYVYIPSNNYFKKNKI